ncbi:MAG: hypothetical protein A2381_20175 [Bdellovibrionales bacterium RIFOXYB1_FULL_37_110]|nr:MAG: hypothetical protein A2181_03810 [Bdellovibrionales bacterium RIFOXYA1_FULL_38_20]OFZ51054.1 MAG: hypothetical protein A2417_19960 [Bdellovibrionales bacterium RIFOXYC1_FULL_37_79]OFZ60266.1 MAG: hypothetical protein A2381_20175 [Bdellovibrionales bacterium RIFOXYB1_FULL_37_110]OFZ63261.1 MAG: hypothetical protein A2577_01490 [Bdellovibrionales bacterium RIFOXYD1_FULL_36_51]
MFKSNLTRTLYQHFIASHFNEKFITEIITGQVPSFVYVDGAQIKLMAGYYKKTIPRQNTLYPTSTTPKELEIVFFDND